MSTPTTKPAPVRTWVDWATEIPWALAALIWAPYLVSQMYVPQGIALFLIALGTIAWTEHLVRSPNRDRDAMTMAGILAALAVWAVANNNRKQD